MSENDKLIPHAFSRDDLEGKRANKRHLLSQLGLDDDDRAPLLGIVSRLTPPPPEDVQQLVEDIRVPRAT